MRGMCRGKRERRKRGKKGRRKETVNPYGRTDDEVYGMREEKNG